MLRRTAGQSLSHALRNECGAQTVEFALSILLLLTMLFAIIEFSLAMYSYEFLAYAAQEGARYAMVRGSDWLSNCSTSAPPNFTLNFSCIAQTADVQNYVKSLSLPGINQNNLTVTPTWPGTTPDCGTVPCAACTNPNTTKSKGCVVKVTVSYSFSFIAPFMPKSAFTFSGASQKVIQQ
jgi:hypothetical protein